MGARKRSCDSKTRVAGRYQSHGTLDGWRNGLAKLAQPHAIHRLAICNALADPLVHLAPRYNIGGGFHLYGNSSLGKTNALCTGASVWGKPDPKKSGAIAASWKARGKGLEPLAAPLSGTHLALDETNHAKPEDVFDAISRCRATSGCGACR